MGRRANYKAKKLSELIVALQQGRANLVQSTEEESRTSEQQEAARFLVPQLDELISEAESWLEEFGLMNEIANADAFMEWHERASTYALLANMPDDQICALLKLERRWPGG